MTAADLSTAAKIGRGSVALMEAGNRIPRVGTVARLAQVLGTSPSLLAYGLDDIGAPGELSNRLAGRLKEARAALGISLHEVGRRAGISAAAVRSVEGGAEPTIDRAEELARAVETSPAWLAFGTEPRELPKRGSRPATVDPVGGSR